MYTTEIKDMVCMMSKMIENIQKLLEEMKCLQADIETGLDQPEGTAEPRDRRREQSRKRRTSVSGQ